MKPHYLIAFLAVGGFVAFVRTCCPQHAGVAAMGLLFAINLTFIWLICRKRTR